MNAIWLLLILVIQPDGTEFRQSIPFDTKEDCVAGVVEYAQALEAADWDIDVHGKPQLACIREVPI